MCRKHPNKLWFYAATSQEWSPHTILSPTKTLLVAAVWYPKQSERKRKKKIAYYYRFEFFFFNWWNGIDPNGLAQLLWLFVVTINGEWWMTHMFINITVYKNIQIRLYRWPTNESWSTDVGENLNFFFQEISG